MPTGAMKSAKLLRSKSATTWQSGPVLSRFDRFLLIGPRAEGGLALRQPTNTNFHFVSKLIVNISGAGSSVFQRVLRERNGSQIIPTVSQTSLNSLYYHHQNTRKPCFTIISLFRYNSCSLSKCLCRQQRQIFKKSLAWSTVFCKRGIYYQYKWTARFLTPSSVFFGKNRHCFQ